MDPIPKRAPNTEINIIRSIKEIIKPAIARPLGALNTPIKENNKPRNHSTPPTICMIGIQLKQTAINASIKPAVPNPFDFLLIWLITIGRLG